MCSSVIAFAKGLVMPSGLQIENNEKATLVHTVLSTSLPFFTTALLLAMHAFWTPPPPPKKKTPLAQ